MTTGTIRRVCLLALALAFPARAELELPELMRALQSQPRQVTKFVETRRLMLLSDTLTMRGELEFRAPDYLRRVQREPRHEAFEVEGGVVTVTRPEEPPQRLSLAEHPPLAAFIESIRATLAGELAALERYYRVRLYGEADSWRLVLHPRPGPLVGHIDSVTLYGEQAELTRMEIIEASGDRSETRFLRD